MQSALDLARGSLVKTKEIPPEKDISEESARVGVFVCNCGINIALEDPNNKINHIYLYDYLKEAIQSGKIKLDKSRNAGKVFTWHDSCKHGRELERNFGTGYFDEPRWILQQCVDQFVELQPNRMNNFCCGAGGGNWPMPYEKESAYHARFKYQQIKNSGANVVVVGCSNCRDQIMKRIPRFYADCNYEVKYIWQLIAESLVFEPWSDEEVPVPKMRPRPNGSALGTHPKRGSPLCWRSRKSERICRLRKHTRSRQDRFQPCCRRRAIEAIG